MASEYSLRFLASRASRAAAASFASAFSTASVSASVNFARAEAFPPIGADMGALTFVGGISRCTPVLCGTTGSSLAGVPCSVPSCLNLA